MQKNYFEVISENVSEGVKGRGFACVKSANEYLFKKEEISYKIVYKVKDETVCLNKENAKGEYNTISSWSIRSADFCQRDAEMIWQDFIQTIVGTEKKITKQLRSKGEEDDSNVDCLFFANRMVSVFPELREEVRIEKECYSDFRGVKFANDKLMPRVNELLSSGKGKPKLQKLFKVIGELYDNGTLDVRSIITMVILNSINGDEQIKVVEDMVSEKLKKAWHAANKYKGKRVKPEKAKKKSNFISRTLMNN